MNQPALRGTTCFKLDTGQEVHVWQGPISKGDPCVCGEAEAPWGRYLAPFCDEIDTKQGCICAERTDHEGDHRCCCGRSWGVTDGD